MTLTLPGPPAVSAPDADCPALRRLIAPLTVAEFLDTVWERTWLHASRDADPGRPGHVDDLATVSDLDEVLTVVHAAGLRNEDAVRVSRGGEPVPPSEWVRPRSDGYTELDVRRIVSLYRNGATVVLNGVQRCLGPVERLCAELSRFFGVQVQANAYLTPPDGQGFPPHPDDHDVFLVQVTGAKRWRLHGSPVQLPANAPADRPARPTGEPEAELTLRAGEVLYLPRGMVHEGVAGTGGSSVHLTIGVHPYTWAQLITDLVTEMAEQDVDLRRSVAPRLGEVDRGDGVEARLATLLERLCDADRVRLIRTRRAAPSREPGRTAQRGRLADLIVPPPVVRDTPVEIADTDTRLVRDGDLVTLRTSEKALTLPAFTEQPLQALLDGVARNALDLGEWLDDSAALVMVRRLVQEGVLERRR